MNVRFELAPFSALSVTALYKILQLRSEVFVVEQQCVYLDLDDKDQKAHHLQLLSEQHDLLAYARILPPGISYADSSIGRVVSNPSFRRGGYGKILMQKAIEVCFELYPNQNIRISAQHYLLQFYSSLGFIPVGEVYLEDEIPHIEMYMEYPY